MSFFLKSRIDPLTNRFEAGNLIDHSIKQPDKKISEVVFNPASNLASAIRHHP
jgi:hypothetical protein